MACCVTADLKNIIKLVEMIRNFSRIINKQLRSTFMTKVQVHRFRNDFNYAALISQHNDSAISTTSIKAIKQLHGTSKYLNTSAKDNFLRAIKIR